MLEINDSIIRNDMMDPVRRYLIISIGKGTLATGLFGVGLLSPKSASAFDLSNLPPGFQIVKDQALIHAYISHYY